jgi:lipoyl(octanoyl) transferase
MKVVDLGRMPYPECAEFQRQLLERVASGQEEDTLLLVEHDPVITLGANFHEENLLLSVKQLNDLGIAVDRSERGGDVTYHGPGQLVVYPIFNLENHGKDLHKWLRNLEEVVIQTLARFGLKGQRFSPHTGVWIEDRKICAVGIKVRRWTSMHGLALNALNDLTPFSYIVPCGIQEYGVTSMAQELGKDVPMEMVKSRLAESFISHLRSLQ